MNLFAHYRMLSLYPFEQAMTLIAGCSFYSYQGYLSSWMGLNGNGIWIKISIMIGVCILAVIGGRIGGHREGYTKV